MNRLSLQISGFISLMVFVMLCANPINAKTVRWEHPRPDFTRTEWRTLNGTWRFDFDRQNVGDQEQWYIMEKHKFTRTIEVPFPWEAPLSGVGNRDYVGLAWYETDFKIPKSWRRQRIWVKFGAVDYHATVYVNGQKVGEHEGGYTPFEFDITDVIKLNGNNILTVRAFDPTAPWQPTGKQINWYTHTSGIWQTVYLEAVPSAAKIAQVHVYPDIDDKTATFKISVQNKGPAVSAQVLLDFKQGGINRVLQSISLQNGDHAVAITVPIEKPELWSPTRPFLYDVTVTLKSGSTLLDRVDTYFGMRKISTGKWGAHNFEYIFLNNQPIYLIGALDQAFNPWGIYTYPSDAYAKADIEKAKKFGFNFLRIHIKVDEPRLLYWADRLGVLLMCDLPSFWQDSTLARQSYQKMLEETVARDFNHPSIFAWCLFNETWGLGYGKDYNTDRQEWVRSMYHFAKKLDPTRLIEDNSPCFYDHVESDINSWHFYINDYQKAKEHIQNVVDNTYPGSTFNYIGGNRQESAPLINSEYGGISAGMGDQDVSWCFKYLTNELRKHKKIGGYVYTELQDIEWEHNGFMDYDQQDKVFGYERSVPGLSYQALNNPDFLVLDVPPCTTLAPGSVLEVPVLSSHFSHDKPIKGTLHWLFRIIDQFGEQNELPAGVLRDVTLPPFDVVKLADIKLTLPNAPLAGLVHFWVTDANGDKIMQNYFNWTTLDQDYPQTLITPKGDLAVTFDPADFFDSNWDQAKWSKEGRGLKSGGYKVGYLDYRLPWPQSLMHHDIKAIEIVFEAAAQVPSSIKVDARFPGALWSRRKPDRDYPQTDITKWPSEVTVSLNGIALETTPLPNDPADARGFLSHDLNLDPGSFGYLNRVLVTGDLLKRILSNNPANLVLRFEVKSDAVNSNGLALFGHRMGAYPVQPMIIFKQKI